MCYCAKVCITACVKQRSFPIGGPASTEDRALWWCAYKAAETTQGEALAPMVLIIFPTTRRGGGGEQQCICMYTHVTWLSYWGQSRPCACVYLSHH